MDVKEKQTLVFHWEKRGDRYVFRCQQDLFGNPDAVNEELEAVARWCRTQRVPQTEHRFSATRRTVSEKLEQFELNGKCGAFSGSTVFHPTRLSVELELPERLGPMFCMAFNVSDERR